jgi:hypothetical protein
MAKQSPIVELIHTVGHHRQGSRNYEHQLADRVAKLLDSGKKEKREQRNIDYKCYAQALA